MSTRAETQGGMPPEGKKQKESFAAFTQIRGEILHFVATGQDIAGLTTEHQTRNSREAIPLLVETRLAPWEYHVEENVFEFDDDFYAIYGTSVVREGRFMAPDVYVREFIHPDDAWIMEATIVRALSSAERYLSGQFEHRIIRRDGEVRTIVVRANVIKDDTGKIIKCYGANQDITAQKTMQKELQISRDKLSLSAELARLAWWEYNFEKNMFEFGDEFYAVYGTSVEQEGCFMAPDVYVREFVHPDDAEVVEKGIGVVLSSSVFYPSAHFEHRIIRRDGVVRTVAVRVNIIRDGDGKIIKYYGANQDITELRESEVRFIATLNTFPDMLCRINTKGMLLDYRIPNQYACYLVKTPDKHNTIDEILPVQLAHLIKKMAASSVKTGETRLNEYAGQINGTEYALQIRTAAITEKEALVIIQDQTELYRSRREFQRLDKLNLIGEMAAAIGHEVRNPMTTVRGYLQMFQAKKDFAKYAEHFGFMIEELDRANSIITEFLSLAKNKSVEMKRGNLKKVMQVLLPLLEADALCRGHQLYVDIGKIPDNEFDEKEIRQLILNLAKNSFEAMKDGGEVRIRLYEQCGCIILTVQDTGTGIPDEVMRKLGTPFVTTKETGTGLGLSVCYQIVERHGAKILVETGSMGTTFTIIFFML